jgi:hypothetical protein
MGFFSDLFNRVKNTVSNLYNKGKETVAGIYNKYIKPVTSKIPIVGDLINNGLEKVGGAVQNLAEGKLKDFGKNALKTGIDFIGSKIPLVGGQVSNLAKDAVNNLKKGGMVLPPVVGGTHPYVMHDGIPKNVYQR